MSGRCTPREKQDCEWETTSESERGVYTASGCAFSDVFVCRHGFLEFPGEAAWMPRSYNVY